MFGGGRGGRQVCKFFLEGRCRFGDNCKNEHPQGQSNQGGGGGGGFGGNRFAPLQNQGGGGGRGRAGAFGGASSNQPETYNVSADGIKIDLADERPAWPLSAYGPGRNAPVQLIEGEIEQSPEEMRVLHYLALAKGNPQESIQREQEALNKSNELVQKILSDLNGAVKYVQDGKDKHPNRLDMIAQEGNAQPAQQGSQAPFGAPSAPAASGFGAPSVGQQSSTFGKPGFGAPSFGQTSKPAAPGFGAPSSLGGGGSSFGQPNALGAGSGLGQPGPKPTFGQSGFGQASQPSFGQTSKLSFGAPSQPGGFGSGGGSSPFAQTTQQSQASPFAQAASQPNGFGQGAQQQQPSGGFGQPSPLGGSVANASPFAAAQNQQPQTTSSFGANATSQTAGSGFGQPSQPGQTKPNPFGQTAQPPTSTFGGASQPSAGGFGNPSTQPAATGFGRSSQPGSGFGQSSQGTTSVFGQPSQPQANGFGRPAQPAASTTSTPAQTNGTAAAAETTFSPSAGPDPSTYLQRGPNGPLSFKGHRIIGKSEKDGAFLYATQDSQGRNKEERLWFPEGPPRDNGDITPGDAYYEGDMGVQLKELYQALLSDGEFKGGVMPEIPPKREWIRYDL